MCPLLQVFLDNNEITSFTIVQSVPLSLVIATALQCVFDDLFTSSFSQETGRPGIHIGSQGLGKETRNGSNPESVLSQTNWLGKCCCNTGMPVSASSRAGCKQKNKVEQQAPTLYFWTKLKKKKRSETKGYLWLFQIYTIFVRKDIIFL